MTTNLMERTSSNATTTDTGQSLTAAARDGEVLGIESQATTQHRAAEPSDEPAKPLWKYLVSTLLTVVMIIALALAMSVTVIPRLIGAVPLRVLTGSMQPRLTPGDMIITRSVDPNNIRIGDIVTFQPTPGDPTLVTHRVQSIVMDGLGNATRFITIGDANNVADDPIIPEQVMGRLVYSIPLIGRFTGGDNTFLISTVAGVALLGNAVAMFLKPDKKQDHSHIPTSQTPAQSA